MDLKRIQQLRLARHDTDVGLRIAIEELARKLNELIQITNELLPEDEFVARKPRSPKPLIPVPEPPEYPEYDYDYPEHDYPIYAYAEYDYDYDYEPEYEPEYLYPYPDEPEYPDFTLIQDGLVFADDFDRADSSDIGGDWVEQIGDWEIADERLTHSPFTSSGQNLQCREDHGDAIAGGFVQCIVRFVSSAGGNNRPIVLVRMTASNGYGLLYRESNGRRELFRLVNGGLSSQATANGPSLVGLDLESQIFSGPSIQEAWGHGISVSSSNSTHNALEGRGGFRPIGQAGDQQEFDDYLRCRTKWITVTGLPSGWKAKVRNAAEAVVAEATESGGVAEIDASRFGGATELCPLSGWPELVVTDGADAIQAIYDAPVYPGHEIEYNG